MRMTHITRYFLERLKNPYFVLSIIHVYFIIFALIVDSPGDIVRGCMAILQSRDILITDYIKVGGVGATLINSALVNFVFIFYISRIKKQADGSIISTFWLLTGFSFFGKNPLSIWPFFIGGYLYSKFKREHFNKYAVVTMLSTTLSPTVSQIIFYEGMPLPLRLLFASFTGILIGFIMPPISAHAMYTHDGYNLYNVGFTAGILAMLARILLLAFGLDTRPTFIWSTEHKVSLTVFMIVIFIFLIVIGWINSKNRLKTLFALMRRTGRLRSDFYTDYGDCCYINMGILGIFSILLVWCIGADINGPVMGGIFTVAGFGCFGKHMRNIWPTITGCLLGGALIHIYNEQNPSAILAVLFGTCLAPIAGEFGWKWGIIAGILHLSIAINVVDYSGGFNLYNNGLAGGLVLMFLLPLIRTFKKLPVNTADGEKN